MGFFFFFFFSSRRRHTRSLRDWSSDVCSSDLDFEGDPGRPLSERRIKRSPLQDVAGMVDSFYTVSHGALFGETPGLILKPGNSTATAAWARYWSGAVGRAFLESYLLTQGVAVL